MQYAWKMRNTYRILIGKPEGKRPVRKLRHRWEDITMELRGSDLHTSHHFHCS
jgi:hypothetical protein